jgi:excinuclease ABC subunit C
MSREILSTFIKSNKLDSAGVYKMFSDAEKVIYVGKAKNLKNRLSSYLNPDRIKVENLVANIANIEVIYTTTEIDALILESHLVKKYNPKYNTLLKDDKSFNYIFIDTEHKYPRVYKHRGKKNKKGYYFGPILNKGYIDFLLNFIQKKFKYRSCKDSEFLNRTRPCIEYQIQRCTAPCVDYVSHEDYLKQIEDIKDFLQTGHKNLVQEFNKKLQEAVEKEDFQTAIFYRDTLKAFKEFEEKSVFRFDLNKIDNSDILAVGKFDDFISIFGFVIRDGVLKGEISASYELDMEESSDDAILKAIFQKIFLGEISIPKKIVTNLDDELSQKLQDMAFKEGCKVSIKNKNFYLDEKGVLELASTNLSKEKITTNKWGEEFEMLEKLIGFKNLETIEVFDNSHLSSKYATGNLICVSKEGFVKDRYRKYNFKTAKEGDDFSMMYEVLKRRLTSKSTQLPSMFLVDGGYAHKGVVLKVMSEVDIYVPFMCIAKGKERNAGNETFFTAEEDYIKLDNKKLLYFLQNIRDEAHRFAITTYRQKYMKGN